MYPILQCHYELFVVPENSVAPCKLTHEHTHTSERWLREQHLLYLFLETEVECRNADWFVVGVMVPA